MRFPRLLFYAVNGLGLGHVTRLLAIARRVRGLVPEAEIVFFTSSEAEDVIYREGFAAFKVPSKTLRSAAQLRPSTYARMLQTVTLNLLASFHPHVLVVDTFPAGALQELLPVLRWDSRKVFIYRAQRPEVARSALMQNVLPLYDLAIAPHAEGEEEAPAPTHLRLVWAGPILIRDRAETLARDEARERLGLPPDEPVVYVTFGGGGDTAMDEALALTLDSLSGVPVHVAVARAPLHRGRLRPRSGVTIVEHYPMAEMLPAFDAAVSAAGYNSTMELLHHGVPTALVPFSRQVDDQQKRARAMAADGAALCVEELSGDAVRTAVEELMEPARSSALRQKAAERVPANGAATAAEAIVGLLG